MFHATSFPKGGVFAAVRCRKGSPDPKSEFLDLFFALTRDGQRSGARASQLLSGGTLFIDEIERLDAGGQKICFEFLKQLQRLRNERPTETGLRVVAGLGKGLSDAIAQNDFLPGLLDLLDKVRVELDGVCDEMPDSLMPEGTFICA
jgi:DNA-binding NtrC family response regulator